jgi:hypothetical protein
MRSGIGAACPFTRLLALREEAFDFFVPVLLFELLAEAVVLVDTFVSVFFALDLCAVLLPPLCAAALDGITPPTAIVAATKPIQVALLNE